MNLRLSKMENLFYIGSSPACGLEKFSGHWKAEGKGKIIAYFENNEVVSYTINIISCTNDLLKIMK